MSKSVPDSPDYTGAAEASAQSSKEVTNMQTFANRPDQVTPWGSTTWSNAAVIDPATGQPVTAWQQNTTLTPEAQRALDAQLGVTADRSELASSLVPRLQNEYGSAMDWSNFTPMSGGLDAPTYDPNSLNRSISTAGLPGLDPSSKYYDAAGDALYGKFQDRADPRFAREEDQLRTRLTNQGLREGDAAWDNAMQDFSQNKNDAYSQAAYDATLKSGEEAQRMLGMDASTRGQLFGENSTQAAFGNQAAGQAMQFGQTNFGNQQTANNYNNTLRQQQIAEAMQQRGFSLNEINAILSGQQVNMPSMPGFSNATKSDATNYLGAAQMQGQYNLDAYNAQQQATQGMISGIGSVAGGAMMFSDRRLKRNIKLIGEFKGYNLYEFDYVWGEHAIGVMADEVDPRHVVRHPSGYDMVDYGSL